MREKGEMRKLRVREERGGDAITISAKDEREERVGCNTIVRRCKR